MTDTKILPQALPQTLPRVEALEATPRPIVAMASDFSAGHRIGRHVHHHGQLLYPADGAITVWTEDGVWVIPPQRALWVPGGIPHDTMATSDVALRTLLVEPERLTALPQSCCAVNITPLMRELILHAMDIPAVYDVTGADGRFMGVILDQLERLPLAPLHLPMPRDPRIKRISDILLEHPDDTRTLDDWAVSCGASARTLSRLFVSETRLTFGAWRKQVRLLKAIELLAADTPVTQVALDLGYESPSAFIAMFRRSLGDSPARYFRRETRAGQNPAVTIA
jgi:AraC-like DNA-binding protein/quercetin dioxygenase-like cupin family protein